MREYQSSLFNKITRVANRCSAGVFYFYKGFGYAFVSYLIRLRILFLFQPLRYRPLRTFPKLLLLHMMSILVRQFFPAIACI